MLKPRPPPPTKVGDPIGAILNQARSTLSQSRQFRDGIDPRPRSPQSGISSNKVDFIMSRKPSQNQTKVRSSAHLDLSKQTSTTVSVQSSKSTSNTEQKRAGISRTPTATKNLNAPSNTGTPQGTKQSVAKYDYESILSGANAPKLRGRSDFNIFKVGHHPTANASVGTGNNETDVGSNKPPPTPPDKGKMSTSAMQRSGQNQNKPKGKESAQVEEDDDDEDDSSSESEGSTSTSSSGDDSSTTADSESDDDDEDDEDDDDEGSTTITPPTITETTASRSKSLNNPNPTKAPDQIRQAMKTRPMSLKAITLDGENNYGSNSRGSNYPRKVTIQDLRDRPVVFSSQESHAVLKAMSPEVDQDQDFDTYSRQFDNPTQKSYSEDFVSEIQSIADDFSKSFARSMSVADVDMDSSSIEIPVTENSGEIPSDNALNSSGGNGKTAHRRQSHTNAMTSLKIVNEIKGNLQDLKILDIVEKFEGEKAATNGRTRNEEEPDEDEYPEDLIIGGSGKNDTTTSSIASGSGITSKSRKSSAESSTAKKPTTNNKRAVRLGDPVKIHASSSSDKVPVPQRTQPQSQPQDKKVPTKPSSQIELTLSRASSRKNFQATLSQVKLGDDGFEEHYVASVQGEELSPLGKLSSEKEEKARKLEALEQKYPYKTPHTKPQTQIHSILEKEIYRKELARLRKEHRKEEKDLRMINEARSKNFKMVQEIMTKKGRSHRQPALNFPVELETDPSSSSNWGAPYFNLDGSLNQGLGYENLPRTPDENNTDYAAQVGNMNVPQLVREVMKSNERMYKMTVKAAKEMGKEYGRNVKVGRKIRDMQPLVNKE